MDHCTACTRNGKHSISNSNHTCRRGTCTIHSLTRAMCRHTLYTYTRNRKQSTALNTNSTHLKRTHYSPTDTHSSNRNTHSIQRQCMSYNLNCKLGTAHSPYLHRIRLSKHTSQLSSLNTCLGNLCNRRSYFLCTPYTIDDSLSHKDKNT